MTSVPPVLTVGTPERVLYERLMADNATGWKDHFGSQMERFCERIVEECRALGLLDDDMVERETPDDFQRGLVVVFDETILDVTEDKQDRIDWLDTVEQLVKKARESLGLPPTTLKL